MTFMRLKKYYTPLINISQLLRNKEMLYIKNGYSNSCDSDVHDGFMW